MCNPNARRPRPPGTWRRIAAPDSSPFRGSGWLIDRRRLAGRLSDAGRATTECLPVAFAGNGCVSSAVGLLRRAGIGLCNPMVTTWPTSQAAVPLPSRVCARGAGCAPVAFGLSSRRGGIRSFGLCNPIAGVCLPRPEQRPTRIRMTAAASRPRLRRAPSQLGACSQAPSVRHHRPQRPRGCPHHDRESTAPTGSTTIPSLARHRRAPPPIDATFTPTAEYTPRGNHPRR